MGRFLIFSLMAFALPVIGVADEGATPMLINPPASGLAVKKVVEEPFYEVQFSGQTWVSGTFRAEWHPNYPDRKPAYLIAVAIKPDQAELGRLPQFSNDQTHFIWLDNDREAVQAVFGIVQATQFRNRQMQVLEVHGRFLIKDYASGECGSPWARAELVSARVSRPATVASGLEIGDC